MGRSRDVVVVGAGVIGLAVTWRARAAGMDVLAVDPRPGRGTSRVAAGMLAPVGELAYGEEELLSLAIDGARRWPDFAGELASVTGLPVGYLPTGTLHVAADPGDFAHLDDLCRFHRVLGLDSTPLTASECRAEEPLLAPGIRGGFLAGGDHQVDNRLLLDALQEALRRTGEPVLTETVASVELARERISGVLLASGERIAARSVVVAAGYGSATLPGMPAGAVPPVRPVKGQLLRLHIPPTSAAPVRTVRGLVNGRPVYLVPRTTGELVLGATSEEMPASDQVRAGAVRSLLDDAARLLPGVDEMDLVEVETAMRPGSPDNRPVIGPAGVDGLVVATGHHRNGILLAPLTADLVAAYLASGDTTVIPAACDPARFASRAAHEGVR